MTTTDLDAVLVGTLAGRRLVEHPFYLRWQAGQVSMAELAAYAGQYRHFEAALPGFLTQLMAALPEGQARDLVAANLADELGDPVAHIELFNSFATAVGAAPDAPSPATVALLATYDELLGHGPAAALAGLFAYEYQAADIAGSKAEGLRRHYGFDGDAVSFWEHHAIVDERHGAWLLKAVAETATDPEGASRAAGRTAEAWWSFLDEREAEGTRA